MLLLVFGWLGLAIIAAYSREICNSEFYLQAMSALRDFLWASTRLGKNLVTRIDVIRMDRSKALEKLQNRRDSIIEVDDLAKEFAKKSTGDEGDPLRYWALARYICLANSLVFMAGLVNVVVGIYIFCFGKADLSAFVKNHALLIASALFVIVLCVYNLAIWYGNRQYTFYKKDRIGLKYANAYQWVYQNRRG